MLAAEELSFATTWTGILTALGVIATAGATAYVAWTNNRIKQSNDRIQSKVQVVDGKVDIVHQIVNSANEKLMAEIVFLKEAYVKSQIRVQQLEGDVSLTSNEEGG